MTPISYTDTDRIRSVLGIDEEDVSDDQIANRDLEKELRLDLLTWVSTHATVYDAGQVSNATETEQSAADALVLYCTYFCAVLVAKSLQLSAPQQISDGKNAMSRFATIDWPGIMDHLWERREFYKAALQGALSTTTVRTYSPFSGVGLGTDPVTAAQ